MPGPNVAVESMWTTAGGLRIHARRTVPARMGERTPVVLVHGFGVSGRYMVPAAKCLGPVLPAYAPDLPGSGRSESPDHALTLPELAGALAAWMTTVGIERATLLGNSFGCQIVVEFALRCPERVDRAILVSPTIDPSERMPLGLSLRLLRDAARERPSEVLISLRDYMRFGPRRAKATFRIMANDRIEDKLPRLTAPTLIVRGERDPIVSQQWVERAAALLPDGRLVVIPGAAHAVNYDKPEALAAVVFQFLGLQSETPTL